MEGKEWFEKSKYVYSLDEHDEGGCLGIDENKVAEMLDEYYQYKLKLLGLHNVRQQRELLIAYENKVGHMDKDEAIKFIDEYLNSEGN